MKQITPQLLICSKMPITDLDWLICGLH